MTSPLNAAERAQTLTVLGRALEVMRRLTPYYEPDLARRARARSIAYASLRDPVVRVERDDYALVLHDRDVIALSRRLLALSREFSDALALAALTDVRHHLPNAVLHVEHYTQARRDLVLCLARAHVALTSIRRDRTLAMQVRLFLVLDEVDELLARLGHVPLG